MKPTPPVPDWLLERLAAGELPPEQAQALEARLDAAGERGRLDALAASSAQILRALPADSVAAEVIRRERREHSAASNGGLASAPAPRAAAWMRSAGRPADGNDDARSGPARFWPVLAVGGSAALALAVSIGLPASQLAAPEDDARRPAEGIDARAEQLIEKGLEPYLSIYRRTKTGPERLSPKARVRAGDTLQLAYVAAGQRFGVVASVDGRGAMSWHLPEAPGAAAPLDDRGETALPHAFELDDTPGSERFVFVTSEAPFDTSAVVALLGGKSQRLPAGLSLRSIELEKSTP